MPRYLVTYNIVSQKSGAEMALTEKLKSLAAKKLFLGLGLWLLKSERDAEDLRNKLMVFIDLAKDGLVVIEMTDNAAFRNPDINPFDL